MSSTLCQAGWLLQRVRCKGWIVMAKNLVRLNQKIRVSLPGHENEWYVSSVQDLLGDEICIAVPVRETRALALFKGEKVVVTYIDEVARYRFVSVVAGRKVDNVPLYILGPPKEYDRIQLRDFVRVPINLQVDYAPLPAEGEDPVFTRSDSLDLSGGGVRLITQEHLPRDTRLLVHFSLSYKKKKRDFRIVGVVARVCTDENTKTHQAGVRFARVTSQEADYISSYLFSVMSSHRRLLAD
jgi:c-di-GMP-binding flagellar brake protein YcgR